MKRGSSLYSNFISENITTGIIAQLPISWSFHGAVAYREKQHFNCKNFSAPLATDTKFVHNAAANSCM
jgi:hypothetical protein